LNGLVLFGGAGFVWKNWFCLEELVLFGRAGFVWKSWFCLEELVLFGRAGFVWIGWFWVNVPDVFEFTVINLDLLELI
jgi:hypothetical protein